VDKLTLDRSVKFRQEDGFILVCHCRKLRDYTLSEEFLPLLETLRQGISLRALSDLGLSEREVLEDLKSLNLVRVEKR
jgi:hypothetical protein